MRPILKFLVILFGTVSCIAQNSGSPPVSPPCKLTVKDLPALEGYKLGMDIADVDQRNIVKMADYPAESYLKAEYDDATYYLAFENKELRIITVLYKTRRFDSIDEFVKFLDGSLNLPDTWTKQTPEQTDIETRIPAVDKQLETAMALRSLMLQMHGKNCRHVKRLSLEIPKIVKARARLEKKRQIGSRLTCNGFSMIAFIDNSIEKGIPAFHLFLPETGK